MCSSQPPGPEDKARYSLCSLNNEFPSLTIMHAESAMHAAQAELAEKGEQAELVEVME